MGNSSSKTDGGSSAALKDLPAQLAAMLRVQGGKGRDECSQIHCKLAEVVTAAVDDPRTAGQALLSVAKDASSPEALMRCLEGGVPKANAAMLKDFVLRVADELNIPLSDSELLPMVDKDWNFCQENVDRIINSSAELSTPKAPYSVISIVGAKSSGKSYLLNCLFGTKFPVLDPKQGWTQCTRGIMMSRCLGSSLLLLDFEGFYGSDYWKDDLLDKQAILFAWTVSDLMMVNISVNDIDLLMGSTTNLWTPIFKEITNLPKELSTQILVVLRFYDGETALDTLRSDVLVSMEKTWKSVNVNWESMRLCDYIQVNIVVLSDMSLPDFPKEVVELRKVLSSYRSGKVPASRFSTSSRIFWDAIKDNRKHDIYQFYRDHPEQSIIPAKSGITSRPFQGVFDNGKVIAVKKLHPHHDLNNEKFENELENLSRAKHQNIISLVGYCPEARDKVVEHNGKLIIGAELDRALYLEYMPGGTLEELLSDEFLDWEARYKIINGICEGLKYLHTGSKDPIYHLDLKPSNILLDKYRIPKIGDFGLSRLLASTGTFVTNENRGTFTYMPPEYMHGRKISKKFDVYSLGIIIVQIIAGREGYCDYRCKYKSPQEFIDNVTGNWCKKEQGKPTSMKALLEVEKCIKMALRCVEDDRANRPTITEIVEELNMIDLHQEVFRADARDETVLAALSI